MLLCLAVIPGVAGDQSQVAQAGSLPGAVADGAPDLQGLLVTGARLGEVALIEGPDPQVVQRLGFFQTVTARLAQRQGLLTTFPGFGSLSRNGCR